MTFRLFVPTAWSGTLLKQLDKDHVYGNLFNHDYEGEVANWGDSVKISSLGDVTIKDYTQDTDIDVPEVLPESQLMLMIDQGKYFNFTVGDVDKAQQKPKVMADAMRRAAFAIADTIDVFLAALLRDGVATSGPDNTLPAITAGTGAADADAYESLVDLSVLLDAQSVPNADRWCVIPPWFHGLLKKDPRFVSFGTEANRRTARGEAIAELSTMMIHVSNNVPLSGTTYSIIAGYKGAGTFADQMSKVEAFRPERRFEDAVKGLYIYGAKVTRPYALASVDADQA